jgi:predicted transcriptional regulator
MEIAETFVGMEPGTLSLSMDNIGLDKIAKAINSETRRTILKLLNNDEMDVSKLAKILEQTEANISAQIKILQDASLVSSRYEPGDHGVRKICFINFKKITINLD